MPFPRKLQGPRGRTEESWRKVEIPALEAEARADSENPLETLAPWGQPRLPLENSAGRGYGAEIGRNNGDPPVFY